MDTTNNIMQTNINRNLLFTNYKYNTRKKIWNLCKCLRGSAKQRPPHSVIAADRKPFPFAGQKIFCHFMSWIWFTHQTFWVLYSFPLTDVRRKSLNADNFIEMRWSVLPSLLPFLQRGAVLSRECLEAIQSQQWGTFQWRIQWKSKCIFRKRARVSSKSFSRMAGILQWKFVHYSITVVLVPCR